MQNQRHFQHLHADASRWRSVPGRCASFTQRIRIDESDGHENTAECPYAWQLASRRRHEPHGHAGDDESATCGRYPYRAIATNLDADGFDAQQVVRFYNQRGECSENRIKELRSDFAAARLPCSDFDANAAYFKVCAIAYNLLALMRRILPVKWESCRAVTIRHRLYAMAGQIVHHANQWTLKLNAGRRAQFEQAIASIRSCTLQ
ncbi:MAG: transposase [Gammaproteobacteria bacterium]|nr:transposase [Gammaproteobacteria bacterium]